MARIEVNVQTGEVVEIDDEAGTVTIITPATTPPAPEPTTEEP